MQERNSASFKWLASAIAVTSVSLGLIYYLAAGRVQQPPGIMAVTENRSIAEQKNAALPDQSSDRKQLLEDLVKNQSLPALQRLLQLNKSDAAVVVRLGLDLRLARPNDPEQLRYRILVPKRLRCLDKELIIVPAIIVPAGSVVGPRPEFVEEKAAFIFDTEGVLQTMIRTGGCKAYRYDLSFTTLGTANSWFVVIDQPTKTSPPFTTHTEIFLVGPNLDLKKPVLSMLHYGAGHVAWTGTPQQAQYGGVSLSFYGPDSLPPERRPHINWETKEGTFVGARRVELDGVAVYEVDITKSTKFREKSP